jgi:hypothetical protein
LPDAIICGRAVPIGEPVRSRPLEEMRLASCEQGAGCIRNDLPETSRLKAADLAGVLTILQSCGATAVGAHTLAPDLNVALGFLEGTESAAVIAPLGFSHAPADLLVGVEEIVRSGRNLTEIVEAINARVMAVYGEMGRLVLLGDPALRPRLWLADEDNLQESQVPLSLVGRSDPQLTWLAGIASASRSLDGLQALEWISLPSSRTEVTRLSGELKDLSAIVAHGNDSTDFDERIGRVQTGILALGRQLVESALDGVHGIWQFGGPGIGLREENVAPWVCDACERTSGRQISYRVRAHERLRVRLWVCPRCGTRMWAASTERRLGIAASTPGEIVAVAGSVIQGEICLRNTQPWSIDGTLGIAVRGGRFRGLVDTYVKSIRLGANESVSVPIALETPIDPAAVLQHDRVSIFCSEGEVLAGLSKLWLEARQ